MTNGRPSEDAPPGGSDAAARAFAELEEKIRASDWSPSKLQEQGMLTKEEADAYQAELNALLLQPLLGELSDDVRRRVEAALTPRQASLAPSSRADLLRQLAAIVAWMHHENKADKLNLLQASLQRLLERLRERAGAGGGGDGEGRGGNGEDRENEERPPETHNFSRLLTDLLADPEQKDKLIKKLMLPNGRMWIDRRVRGADRTEKTIRIWLSLDLTAEERTASTDAEHAVLTQTIEDKLRNIPGSLRFRIDDLSPGHSWKDQWTEMKRREGIPEAIANLKSACITSARRDDDVSVSNAVDTIATRIGLVEEGEVRNSFTRLLKHYTTFSGAEMDLWTHVRNAYWHASEWKNDTDAAEELQNHNPTATLPRPTVEGARIHLWQKITEEPRSGDMEGKVAHLSYNGVKFPPQSIVKTVVADGPQKGTWYQIGPHHVREEHLRISLRQNPPLAAGDPLTEEGTFELLAWDALQQPPNTPPPPERRPSSRPPPAPPKRGTPRTSPPRPQPPPPPAERRPEPPNPDDPKKVKNIFEELEEPEGFVVPTDEKLIETWLRAHTGTKMKLKVHATVTPDPIPCMVSPDQTRTSSGHIRLHYINKRGQGNNYFDVAELRRLNLP